jgi:hypothetical protein
VYIQAIPTAGTEIISVGDSTLMTQQALGTGYQYGYKVVGGIAYNNSFAPTDTLQGFNKFAMQNWIHLAFTVNSSTDAQELFINGISVSGVSGLPQDSAAFTLGYGNSTKANIGARSNLSQFFNGMIDDIAIYNRELSPQEVLLLYQQGLPCSPIPQPPVTNSPTICGSDSATIVASGIATSAFRWYNAATGGDLLFVGNPFKTPILSSTTYYYVSSVVNNNEGPRTKVTVRVFPAPQLTCSIPGIAQSNLPISISSVIASGTAPFNYGFDFGNGSKISSQQSSILYQYIQPGHYEINISVTDSSNCSAVCTGSILVVRVMAKDTTICGNGSATLFATGGATYRWYDAFTDGNLLFAGDPFKTPILSSTTNYYVCDYENNLESPRVKVAVTIFPQPELSCSAPPEVVGNDSFTFSTSIKSGIAPFRYLFDFGDGSQTTTTQQTIIHEYNNYGTYAMVVSVTDSNGCATTCSESIRCLEIFIPNIITANNDTLNDKLTVFQKASNHWESYSGPIFFSMKIVSRWGNQVYQTNNPITGWDGRNVDAGVYFYEITFGRNRYNGWVTVLK